MATDLFLIRKNQTFAKYTQVEGISLTSTTTQVISGVTGTESTNIITLPVGMTTPALGSIVYFSALTGGSGLSTNRMYYVLSPSGNDFKLAETPGGTEVNFTTNVTAATMTVLADDEIRVWSSEYRDMFATQGSVDGGVQANLATFPLASQFSFPGVGSGTASTNVVYASSGAGTGATATFTPTLSSMSDEAAHAPLRQTLLKRTHWKFDMGASVTPQYLYASWQDGDTIANNAPDSL